MKPEHLPSSIRNRFNWGFVVAAIWAALPWISQLLIKNYRVESHADPVAYFIVTLLIILNMASFNAVLFSRSLKETWVQVP